MAISVGKIYFCFDFPYSHTTLFCVPASIRPCYRENNYGFKFKFIFSIFLNTMDHLKTGNFSPKILKTRFSEAIE